ncbi:MAG: hypothetical protein HY706_03765 [Candidatus Hydrogenedentes bacterium]|nr:hypothetical protein [Candidatus Hydrogenedentota bacterium]
MDVIIDGQPDFRLQGNPTDVFAAVAAVGEFLREQGRAFQSVKVDGRSIAPDRLAPELSGKSLAETGTLDITSEELDTLIANALEELRRVLPELPQACHSLAAVFHSDRPQEGFEPFRQLAEIWEQVKAREGQVANALDLSFAALDVDGIPFHQWSEDLNRFLLEAADALAAGDCILLGDLLEYELAPRAEAEARIVAALQERARLRSQ